MNALNLLALQWWRVHFSTIILLDLCSFAVQLNEYPDNCMLDSPAWCLKFWLTAVNDTGSACREGNNSEPLVRYWYQYCKLFGWRGHVTISEARQQCLQDLLHYSEPNKHWGAAIIYLNQSTGMSLWSRALGFPPALLTKDRGGWRVEVWNRRRGRKQRVVTNVRGSKPTGNKRERRSGEWEK